MSVLYICSFRRNLIYIVKDEIYRGKFCLVHIIFALTSTLYQVEPSITKFLSTGNKNVNEDVITYGRRR
jgi:hypothetical protein